MNVAISAPSLNAVQLATVAVWYAFLHIVIAWLVHHHEGYLVAAYTVALIGLAPFLFWALADYKTGALIAILALPFYLPPQLVAAPAKNFAYPIAIATVLGFAIRPSSWKTLRVQWDQAYWWLLAVGVSVAMSLLLVVIRDGWVHIDHQLNRPGSLTFSIGKTGQILLALSFVVVLVQIARDHLNYQRLIDALLIGAVVTVIIGASALIDIAACSGGRLAKSALIDAQRVTGTFYSVTSASAYLSMVAPFFVYRYASAKRPMEGLAWLVILSIAVVLIASTQSRTGFLALLLAAGILLLLIRHQRHARFFGAAFAALSAVVVLTVWQYPGCACPDAMPNECEIEKVLKPSDRAGGYPDKSDTALARISADTLFPRLRDNHSVRLELAYSAVAAWKEVPVTGVGIGMLSRNPSFGNELGGTDAHNVFLTTLAELGLLGFVSWTGLFAYLGYRVWRSRAVLMRADSPLPYAVSAAVVVVLFHSFHQVERAMWGWVGIAIALIATSEAMWSRSARGSEISGMGGDEDTKK